MQVTQEEILDSKGNDSTQTVKAIAFGKQKRAFPAKIDKAKAFVQEDINLDFAVNSRDDHANIQHDYMIHIVLRRFNHITINKTSTMR